MESGDSISAPTLRLVSFVSQEELERAKSTRGERVEDGTAQRDRPLFEILRENKEKKDAEFNERFKHRPPKALDEDETEFLDKLETSRKEYEQKQALEEAEQLRSFQTVLNQHQAYRTEKRASVIQEAVAAHASIVHELKVAPSIIGPEECKPTAKKSQKARPLSGFIVSVRPQAKKAKTEPSLNCSLTKSVSVHDHQPVSPKSINVQKGPFVSGHQPASLGGLVSYSDDSEGDDS